MNTLLLPSTPTDPELIRLHLDGDAAAFRRIVERYQGMVCALAYSACGDVARSEDLAQEVFITAWKQLPQLREPEKLRGWLGGITRNLCHNAFRRAQRTPTADAAELSDETPADAADPRDRAIGSDEAALMWSALAGLPENYREPMVLFYREQHSVAAVAEALGISDDAVKQRLARGRALLTERMSKLVEETLERSAPTPAFAGMVLAALPHAGIALGAGAASKAVSAAALASSAAAKGGVAIKALAAFAALPALLSGVTDYLRFRAHLATATAGNRHEIIRTHVLPLLINAVLLGGMALVFWVPLPSGWTTFVLIALAAAVVVVAVVQDRQSRPADRQGSAVAAPAFEYRSRSGWLGLPWVHVVAGGPWRKRKAVGWIALSDGRAVGGLFASAPLAFAPVAMGGVAVGLLGLGGLAIGIGTLGVMGAGGWVAGGMAVAAQAAQGGLVFAREFATGVVAVAPHANDAVAREFLQAHLFFRGTALAWRVAVWMAFFGWLPPLLLIGWHLGRARGRK